MVLLVLIRVRRRLRQVNGTFNCRFESMRCKVYFDMMKLLLPFLIFEFEVVMLLAGIISSYYVIILVIVLVMIVELVSNGFGI